jgi:SAM-dependent methyltransferase
MKLVSKALHKAARSWDQLFDIPQPQPKAAPNPALDANYANRPRVDITLRPEFAPLQFAGLAMQKLLDDFEFETVLDVGSGAGEQTDALVAAGKKVTAIDYGLSVYFEKSQHRIETIVADFNSYDFGRQFDCVWCSHTLEHQLDNHTFLKKLHSVTREGGLLAITVPPLKHLVVGGHVSLWNAGLLLYRLVLAGFDCRDAHVLSYDYNISVIVKKRTVEVLDKIVYDSGDVLRIREHLPEALPYISKSNDTPFDGRITRLNW